MLSCARVFRSPRGSGYVYVKGAFAVAVPIWIPVHGLVSCVAMIAFAVP